MPSTISGHSHSLPLELVEHILTNVDDKKSLRNCSLVSKIFVYPSQKLLFRDIKLLLVPDTIEYDEHTTKVKPNVTEQVIDFLISSPRHTSMVLNIIISGNATPNEAKSTSRWTSTIGNIRKLLPNLTHLRYLIMVSSFVSDWTMINLDLRHALLGFYVLPTLQHLELQYTGMSEQELLSLIRIPRLTLVGVNSIPMLSSDNLKKGLDDSPLPMEGSLRELKIVLRGSETANCMFNITKAAGTTLKSLFWLTSPYLRTFYHIPREMTLHDLPSLVFFTTCIPLDAPTIDNLTVLFKSTNGLKSRLEIVELMCDYEYLPDEATTSSWDWQGLDAVLGGPTYAALRELKISVKKMTVVYRPPSTRQYDIQSREVLSLFRSKLPSTLENGVVIEG